MALRLAAHRDAVGGPSPNRQALLTQVLSIMALRLLTQVLS